MRPTVFNTNPGFHAREKLCVDRALFKIIVIPRRNFCSAAHLLYLLWGQGGRREWIRVVVACPRWVGEYDGENQQELEEGL